MTSGSHTGSNLGDAVKKGVGLVHGTGEALRGNFNAAVDNATGDRESAARHEAIASHGADEIDRGYHHAPGTGAGVTPVDTDRNRTGHVGHHAAAPTTSTNYGPHDTNVGNKLDPRYDSNPGGALNTSTNYGPNDTNVGNKLDPRYDSELGSRNASQVSVTKIARRSNTHPPLDFIRRESEPIPYFTSAYEDMEARHAAQAHEISKRRPRKATPWAHDLSMQDAIFQGWDYKARYSDETS